MSDLFHEIKSRLRGSAKNSGKSETLQRTSPHLSPKFISSPMSPSFSRSIARETVDTSNTIPDDSTPRPLWLNPIYTRQIVKGNLMILSTKPPTVDQGEWMAHQVVEHYRLLWNFVRVVLEKENNGSSACTCSKMSAGRSCSYTWLNYRLEKAALSASEYMTLVGQWMSSKIDNPQVFPTDPNTVSHTPIPALDSLGMASGEWIGKQSGFPEDFAYICRIMFLQMFRVYAHLFWNHFVEPFYHLEMEKQLTSSFSHFIITATSLDMLKPGDLGAMQLLIDNLAADGIFPPGSKAYKYATA